MAKYIKKKLKSNILNATDKFGLLQRYNYIIINRY